MESHGQTFMSENVQRREKYAHLTSKLGDHQRRVVEMLCANFDFAMRSQGLNLEDTTTTNIDPFLKYAKPIITRVMPALVSNDLFSVQPIPLPTAKVFFKDLTYDTALAPTAVGDRIDFNDGASVRNFNFASGVIIGEAVGTGDGTKVLFSLQYNPVVAASVSVLVNSVSTAVTVNATAGTITFASAPASAATITASYSLVMEGLGGTGNAKIPGLALNLSDTTIDAQTFKLLASYTLEGSQDYRAYHGGDLDAELADAMGVEMALEIDRLNINAAFNGAGAGNVSWSKTVLTGYTAREWYENLMGAVSDASSLIFQKRLVNANWIICNPATFQFLDKAQSFRVSTATDGKVPNAVIGSGPNVFGTLGGRWKVIVDPLFAANKILVGFKGDWQQAGLVYAPYIQAYTDTFVNPATMKPVKAIMQRAGIKLINGNYYSTVTLTS